MVERRIRIQFNRPDVEAICDALSVTEPGGSESPAGPLKAFRSAVADQYVDVTLTDLETTRRALEDFSSKSWGQRRVMSDEALQRVGRILHGHGHPSDETASAGNNIDEWDGVLLNRNPIYDWRMKAVGYEARAHNMVGGATPGGGSSPIGDQTITDLIAENLDVLASNSWVLVTLPWSAIANHCYEAFPRDRVVIGIEEGPLDGPLNDEFYAAVRKLAAQGYRLALPGDREDFRPVAGLANILKVNLAKLEKQACLPRLEPLRNRKASLLISGIETYQDFESCKELGFELLEGSFFCKPQMNMKPVPVTRLALLRLLAVLQNPEVRLQEVEDVIRYDVSLSYRLLRFVNSASVNLSREILSLKHAAALVGIERIRRWAGLLLFTSVENKPRELVQTAAIRARICEQLADSDDEHRRATFFTAGLLSVLDALVDRPMAEAIQGLPLSQELSEALVYRRGPLGTALWAVIAYEQSDWQRHALLRFRPAKLRRLYLDSVHWAQTVTGGLMI